MGREQEPYDGEERRKDRLGRVERDVYALKREVSQIQEDLKKGDEMMSTLKSGQEQLQYGQQLMARDLRDNTDATRKVEMNTEALVLTFNNLIGFRRVVAWVLGVVIAVSTGYLAFDSAFEKAKARALGIIGSTTTTTTTTTTKPPPPISIEGGHQ